MAKKRGRPKLDPQKSLAERMEIRLSTKEKVGFEQAAEAADLRLSVWMRDRLQAAAKRELKRLGVTSPFSGAEG